MNPSTQSGFTLPEILAAIIVTGLMISLIGSFASTRLDAAQYHAQRTESRYLASLVDHAYRRGLLADDASTATDLQRALPGHAIPARLGSGQVYKIALDGGDSRVLVDIVTRVRDGITVTRSEVIRAPLQASELRIPFWRAEKLRQIREEAE